MGNLKFFTKKEISKNIFLITAKNKIEVNKYLIERIGLATSKKILNLLISGGNSLNSLLKELSLNHNLVNKINFYLTDERLVKYNSRYSNEKNIKFYLYKNNNSKLKINFNSTLNIINTVNKKNLEKISNIYSVENKFPMCIMGVGSDGHLASIFYNDKIHKTSQGCMTVLKKIDEKFDRISVELDFLINLPVIIFVIHDMKKKLMLKKMIKFKKNKRKYPVTDLMNRSKGKVYIVTSEYLIKSL
jgi:6-phosphogluconolactonase/glucosamine-6-phosphate isomerase/deaminase